jgi:hypothetical protein
MSRKFSPLSAAVAVATASVIVTVAGCAMGTRSNESTNTAGLSRESTQNSQAVDAANTPPAPGTMTANASATPPAQWTAPGRATTAMPGNDTAMVPPADQSASTSTPSTAYPPSTTSPMPSSSDTSSAMTTASKEPSLAPRSDRN